MHKQIENNRRYAAKNREKIAAYQREYRKKNSDRLYKKKAEWAAANRDKANGYSAKYCERHPERVSASSSKYYRANIEKRRAWFVKFYAENKERLAAARKKWRAENPDAAQAIGQNQNMRRRYAVGDSKINPGEWEHLKILHGGRCAYCQKSEFLTMDHVIPVSRGGLHHIRNIVPACKSCNSRKGTKTAQEFWANRFGRVI